MLRGLLIIALLVGGLSYLMFKPLPSNLAERSYFEAASIFMRLFYYYPVKFLSRFGDLVQLRYTRTILHNLCYATNVLASPFPQNDLQITDTKFDGVPVRVYEPLVREGNGAIFYFHGGGFVLFDVDAFDGVTRELARMSKMVVISVGYRKAPEHIYPTAHDDCERALYHFLTKAHTYYMVHSDHVAVMGDSAGGNLAAAMSLRLQKRTHPDGIALPKIKAQVLFYPVVQFVDFLLPSYQLYYQKYADSGFLDPDSLIRWLLTYVGLNGKIKPEDLMRNRHHTKSLRDGSNFANVDASRLPAIHKQAISPSHIITKDHENATAYDLLKPFLFNREFNPLFALNNFSHCPRTYIVTCEYDILRDEGILFANRLVKNGVPVTHKHYEGGMHALINMHAVVPLARKAMIEVVAYLRNILIE